MWALRFDKNEIPFPLEIESNGSNLIYFPHVDRNMRNFYYHPSHDESRSSKVFNLSTELTINFKGNIVKANFGNIV